MRGLRFAVFGMLCLIWGSEWIAVRDIDITPLLALAIRYGIAALVLSGVVVVRRIRLPDRRRTWIAAAAGVTMLALPIVLTSWAAQKISPGLLVVLLAMTPLLAALLEGRANGALLLALVGGIGGTALLASHGLSFGAVQIGGAIAVFAAALSVSGSVVVVKRCLPAVPPLMIAAIQLGSGALALGIAAIATGQISGASWTPTSLMLEAIVAVPALALAWPLYYWLLRRFGSYQLTAAQWAITAIALLENVLLLRATPSWRITSGIAIVLGSLWALLRIGQGDDRPLTIKVLDSSFGS